MTEYGCLHREPLAQQAGLFDLLHRQEIPVPAPVVEHAEQHPVAVAGFDHLVGLLAGEAQGLVDYAVLAGVHDLDAQVPMRVVGRGDDHEFDLVVLEQIPDAAVGRDAVVGHGLGAAAGVARAHRV